MSSLSLVLWKPCIGHKTRNKSISYLFTTESCGQAHNIQQDHHLRHEWFPIGMSKEQKANEELFLLSAALRVNLYVITCDVDVWVISQKHLDIIMVNNYVIKLI